MKKAFLKDLSTEINDARNRLELKEKIRAGWLLLLLSPEKRENEL